MRLGDRLLTGLRVLVVDDNADQLNILGILRGAGAHVTIAFNAQEAFDSFQADPPDVVISDLSMPYATVTPSFAGFERCPRAATFPP